MTFANVNPNYTRQELLQEFWLDYEKHPVGSLSHPRQFYVALFRDLDGFDDDNLHYTGSGDESEFSKELSFYTGVNSYSRKSVRFSLISDINGVVTFANSTDLVWTNTDSIEWPAPNYILFSWDSIPMTSNTNYYVTYFELPTNLQKSVNPNGEYRIPPNAIRIVY